jgi:hypothetical protein
MPEKTLLLGLRQLPGQMELAQLALPLVHGVDYHRGIFHLQLQYRRVPREVVSIQPREMISRGMDSEVHTLPVGTVSSVSKWSFLIMPSYREVI